MRCEYSITPQNLYADCRRGDAFQFALGGQQRALAAESEVVTRLLR